MDTYSHNIASDIAREYKNTDTDLSRVEENFHKQTQSSLSGYILYDYTKKELANTMLNTLYAQDNMDTNPYHDQIQELYEHLDEKMEIIDAYMAEYALRNQITPWVYDPKLKNALLYVEQTKGIIRTHIQHFKITASRVETEVQREILWVTYQQLSMILSNYIGQIEEYF